MEGFKNCRKGTNVAGQSTALFVSTVSNLFVLVSISNLCKCNRELIFSLLQKAVSLGITDVRLKIQGLGPGRMVSNTLYI